MNMSEGFTIEFRESYTDEIKKTVIAFANTAGGHIYIGIDDDGSVVGLENADDVMLRASNAVRDAIRPDVTMFVSYRIDKIDDKNVLIIDVQKGTACPYHLESKGIRPSGIYVGRMSQRNISAMKFRKRRKIFFVSVSQTGQLRTITEMWICSYFIPVNPCSD